MHVRIYRRVACDATMHAMVNTLFQTFLANFSAKLKLFVDAQYILSINQACVFITNIIVYQMHQTGSNNNMLHIYVIFLLRTEFDI